MPDKKLFLYFFISLIFLTTNESLLIKNINFSFLEKNIVFSKFSYFFTAFAILLFINSLNMFDGINLQSGLYIIFFLIILFFKLNYNIIFLQLTIILSFFLYLNYTSKIFMGESGINFLGFFLSYFSIFSYNNKIINYVDEVFLIMCIPGFDLLRLSITRLISGKHPFTADKNHIHHKLLNKYNQKMTKLRMQIDGYDEKLLEIIGNRMQIVDKIGQLKKEKNVAILQNQRWNEILNKMTSEGKEIGLSPEFIMQLFKAIHQESINHQEKVMNK
jgi:chorismate mutase